MQSLKDNIILKIQIIIFFSITKHENSRFQSLINDSFNRIDKYL